MAPGTALKVGDTVSVPATAFGQDWAKHTYPSDWVRKKLEGTVKARGAKTSWRLSFPPVTEDDEPMDVTLPRKDITFVRRPEATTIHVEADDEASSGEDEPEKPMDDSSDPDEISGINDTFFNEEPDHEVKTGKKDSYKKDIMPGWKRDDGFCFDQRSKVSTSKDPPKLNLPQEQVNEKSFFELGCLFLPMLFLELMAAAMTTQGRVKHDQGDVSFSANWTVTTNDLLQWIGVWMYMLAFPQPGGRRVYWEEPKGGFGPRHKLQAWLRLGDNGEKGVRWFENMLLCFTLPGYTRGDKVRMEKGRPFPTDTAILGCAP